MPPTPPQYPVGTVAMYGPDDQTTTKIAAGVILRDGAEPILKRWVATDVTTRVIAPPVPESVGIIGDGLARDY